MRRASSLQKTLMLEKIEGWGSLKFLILGSFMCGLSRVRLSATPWTLTLQGSSVLLCLGFPRQEDWSGLPCPPPGDLPDPGIEPMRRGTDTPVHRPETTVGSTHSSKRGLRPPEQLERQVEFPSSDKTRPDSPVPTLHTFLGPTPKLLNQKLWGMGPSN